MAGANGEALLLSAAAWLCVAFLCMAFLGTSLLWPGAALAADRSKQDYSVIVGTVWTADDRPAPGVTVKIRRADRQKAEWELRSNGRGEFVLHLPVGSADYVLWAEVNGRRMAATEMKVHVDDNERQDIGLHLKE